MTDPPRRRMPAGERRQQVLDASVAAFAEGGYTGTTTDDVARHAGVSQPYVSRMFRTKQALFLAAYAHTTLRIEAAFRVAAAAAADDDVLAALGDAYVDLVADRNLLRVMQHGFVAASDPVLGPHMRDGLLSVYRLVRELSGAGAEEARDFLARGMLINTLVVLEVPEHLDEDPAGAELLACVLEGKGRPGDAHS